MISIIVAVAENGIIGDKNTLLWHISEDLRRFKALTTGHPVVMGRKTFESLGRPLPNRRNVVISRRGTRNRRMRSRPLARRSTGTLSVRRGGFHHRRRADLCRSASDCRPILSDARRSHLRGRHPFPRLGRSRLAARRLRKLSLRHRIPPSVLVRDLRTAQNYSS